MQKKPKAIEHKSTYFIQETPNLIATASPTIISNVTRAIRIAKLEESILGEMKKLIKPNPTDIKIRFDDLM